MHVCICVSCSDVSNTFETPMDCESPGSSISGILQARILECVVISFSRESSLAQGLNLCLPHCRQIFCQLSHEGTPRTIRIQRLFRLFF